MLIEFILALILGILAGTITGLLPGIHINLVSVLLVSLSSSVFLNIPPIFLVIFIVAMSITHTFLDFIPSIFLGAPDEDTGLSTLPGHKLLLKGKAHEAVVLTAYGSILALPIILIFSLIFIFLLPKIQNYLQNIMFLILITASIFLISTEKSSKTKALMIFLLSGFLGISTLNLNLNNSLLPLLTGLFGGSSLITSIIKKQKIPEQKITKLKEIKPELKKPLLASILSAPLCSFLPSLGSGQVAVIGSSIISTENKEFLVLIGSLNTIVMGLSFVTLYSIQKSRTGSAAAVSKLLSNFQLNYLAIIILAIIFSSIISFFLTIYLSKVFSKIISKINYSKLSIFILAFLVLIVIIFSGVLGLLVFITSTFLGLTSILLKIRRTHLMGSLMIPTILLYLPF